MASAGRFALAHSCLVRAGGAELWLPHASSEACQQAALSPVAHQKLSCPFWLPPDAAHSFVNTNAAGRLQAAAGRSLCRPLIPPGCNGTSQAAIACLHAPTEFKNFASDMHPNSAPLARCVHVLWGACTWPPVFCLTCLECACFVGCMLNHATTLADAFHLYFIFCLSCISHYLSPAHPTTATTEPSSHLRALAGQGRPLTSADIC